MAVASLKHHFQAIKRGSPGRRFQDHYRHEKSSRHRRGSAGRLVRLGIGIIAVLIGLVFCFIPGPGIPFIFFGGAFLAAESLVVARVMDWLELRFRKLYHWGKAHWDALPLWAKIVVALLVAAGGTASTWFFWRLLH